MIRYKIYQNQQKRLECWQMVSPRAVSDETFRPCQTCRTHVEAQFTVIPVSGSKACSLIWWTASKVTAARRQKCEKLMI